MRCLLGEMKHFKELSFVNIIVKDHAVRYTNGGLISPIYLRCLSHRSFLMLRTILAVLLALLVLPSIAAAQRTFDVYILAGQSNADGRGLESDILDSPLLDNPSNAIISYLNPAETVNGVSDGDVSSNGFQNLAAGFSVAPGERVESVAQQAISGNGVPSGDNYFGLELSFANAIGAATGSTNDVAIIKVTRGGTNLRNDWRAPTADDPTGGFLYEALIGHVNASLDQLTEGGNQANVQGFLWHQGESDSGNSTTIENYPGLFTDLVDGVRDNFGDDIPVVLGELAPNRPGNTVQFNDTIQTLDDPNSSEFISGVSVVSSAGLTTPGDITNEVGGDFTHFDALSQIELGERFATSLASTVFDVDTFLPGDSASFSIQQSDNTLNGAGLGGTLTSDESGAELTLTVTDIVSHVSDTDASLVSLREDPDAGHVVNINGGNSLGINGGSGGHTGENVNFSPGEAVTFVFDEDVEFVSIDLQSFDAAGENNGFRISSSAFSAVEIRPEDLLDSDDANDFDFAPGLIVRAGTEITFEAFSTTGTFNAADSFRIQDFSVNVVQVAVPEPSSLAILGLMSSVVAIRRRR